LDRPISLTKRVSPLGKAVYHPPDAHGHPGHYHPVIGESASGNPITRNTPHISDQYTGNFAILPLLMAGAKEVQEIVIELSPAGDIRTIMVDGPEVLAALRETLQILQAEAARDAYLRSTAGASNMLRVIDPQLPPPAQNGFPTRAGDWRRPGFGLGGG
jgi:DNA-binding protein YbaB